MKGLQTQLPLIATPASRTTDPASSHLAEQEHNASGNRQRQQQIVLELVKRYPNRTTMELAVLSHRCRYMIGRRVSELESAGLIHRTGSRVCSISNRTATIWA